MYVDIVPNRNSKPAILLREAWRESGKIKKRTIANLSNWPAEKVEALRRVLRGDYDAAAAEQPEVVIERSLPHGAAAAVLGMMKKLRLEELMESKRCRERDLAAAMVAERLLHPGSKLATSRLFGSSTLAEELGVGDADEDELYAAMDWLFQRQARVEEKLAARHLGEGRLVLYDATSSYYEGRTCPLADWGHNRDGKRGKKIIVYGVLTDGEGCPVAVTVYKGNTGDSTTVADQVEKLRDRFGLERVVLVGDRGMLAGPQLAQLREHDGLGWITALRSGAIRSLVDSGAVQMSLFDERNLVEISSPPGYPGERLIVCRNPLLQAERSRKREELLGATEKELGKIAAAVSRRKKKVMTGDEIGIKVGKVIGRWKVGKHFRVEIADGRLEFWRDDEAIKAEASLDGLYVIRTSEPPERLSAADTVRSYKGLSAVERLFRTLKGLDLKVRPIFHRAPDRVRAHIFICLLAYYVEWHMRKALAPLLFDDEFPDQDRDPVAPAQISAHAKAKKRRRQTADGLPLHSFNSLLQDLATLTRNTCRIGQSPAFTQLAKPTPLQTKAFELLEARCQ